MKKAGLTKAHLGNHGLSPLNTALRARVVRIKEQPDSSTAVGHLKTDSPDPLYDCLETVEAWLGQVLLINAGAR